jgi:hypothetical protein
MCAAERLERQGRRSSGGVEGEEPKVQGRVEASPQREKVWLLILYRISIILRGCKTQADAASDIHSLKLIYKLRGLAPNRTNVGIWVGERVESLTTTDANLLDVTSTASPRLRSRAIHVAHKVRHCLWRHRQEEASPLFTL